MAAAAQTHELVFDSVSSQQRVEMRQVATFSYKLPKHFSLGLEEELRSVVYSPSDGAFFSKSYTSIDLGYKLYSHQSLRTGYEYGLRLNVGYTLKFDAKDLADNRAKGLEGNLLAAECIQHRPFASLTGSIEMGNWKLSLKETYRINFRTDSVKVVDKWNPEIVVNEKNPCLMELKSKVKLDYSLPGKPMKLFCFGEATATLNEQTCPWKDKEGEPFYGGQYLRSAKASVGMRWKIDKHNALGLSYLYYFKQDRDINITGRNSSKRQNVELTWEQTHTHAIVLEYELGY